jgi:NADPH-dependent curcumin reductase CurA
MATKPMTTVNRQIRLAARPAGLPKPEDWSHTSEPVPEPAEGQFLARTRYVSLDPAMRGWLSNTRSYVPPVEIGAVMRAGSLVEVVASNHPDYAPGDHLTGFFGVQEYVLSDGTGAFKVDAADPVYLGGLGMTGLTAYFGLLEVGAMKRGETVVISAAAGAVGSMAGQIAKVHDCRAIGIAGGEEKCRLLTEELGFDAAVDYKAGNVRSALREHAPDGIDVYFDNVGGEILDAALANLRMHARVVICGAISQYNEPGPRRGPANYMALLVKRARMQGFLVFDYADRYREAAKAIAGWIAEGRVQPREQVVRGGVDDFPETLLMLFRGENTGKLVLDVTAAR